jgi:hypothetical protein
MSSWKVKTAAVALGLCGLAPESFAQGVLQITFDAPPVVAPGTGVIVTNYFEGGMLFQPLLGSRGFSRWGAATDPRDPNDGTAFVRASLGQSLMFNFTNGSSFDLLSVDLAGYSSVVPDATIEVVGYRADGSKVMTNVDRHGIIFQTLYFGPEFSDLTRVEIPNSLWSLDNLAVSVPEPSAAGLWLLGLASLIPGFMRHGAGGGQRASLGAQSNCPTPREKRQERRKGKSGKEGSTPWIMQKIRIDPFDFDDYRSLERWPALLANGWLFHAFSYFSATIAILTHQPAP